MRTRRRLAWVVFACLTLAGCSSTNETAQKTPPAEKKPEVVPEVYRVNLDTSKGAIVIEVHRAWAPHGADQVYSLVKTRYYDGNRFYRVVRNFVVQFGINGDPATTQLWSGANIPDDKVKEHNTRGSVTFAATRMPNSRAAQLFINLKDNRALDKDGFAPVGRVVEGMDVVDSLYNSYGEMAPAGHGPDPVEISRQGNDYLANHFPRLDYIKTATVQ